MRASILWTGGKDSAFVFYKARTAGWEIVNLLTFVPKNALFLAHPLSFMGYQAESIGIPHYEVVVEAPLEDGYEKAIRSFRDKYKIDALITGDIAEVDSQPNWIRQRSANSGIKVITPLWGSDRYRLFTEMLACGFKAVVSCIKKGCLTEEWLGKELDGKALADLRGISNETGLDICGENGEYHTLTIDGPIFTKSLIIGGFSKHENESLQYIKPYNITLADKS